VIGHSPHYEDRSRATIGAVLRRATKIDGEYASEAAAWIACGVVVLVASPAVARGPQRFHVEGKVTFDGKPVPSGTIRFEPDSTKGNTGPVGYAAIIDGRYTTATEGSKGSLRGSSFRSSRR
jgi:hypothetical protein